ncbi:hypothetical protein BC830DRAFT_1116355, partial [Chytriomyces sp. MP71]
IRASATASHQIRLTCFSVHVHPLSIRNWRHMKRFWMVSRKSICLKPVIFRRVDRPTRRPF